jgi:hypothetical protein
MLRTTNTFSAMISVLGELMVLKVPVGECTLMITHTLACSSTSDAEVVDSIGTGNVFITGIYIVLIYPHVRIMIKHHRWVVSWLGKRLHNWVLIIWIVSGERERCKSNCWINMNCSWNKGMHLSQRLPHDCNMFRQGLSNMHGYCQSSMY